MLPIRNVVVGMSGGVDSTVAALLLKNKGFNVKGVFMKNWDLNDEQGDCNITKDFKDAEKVCQRLNIPFYEVNFVKDYWNDVFMSFTSDYEKGLTPNPDVLCNKFIKFKVFFDYAMKTLKADAIATGHYAKTSFGDFLENYKHDVNVKLLQPKDLKKDQTFFLSQISQESLRKTMFPLANFIKSNVKKIAMENGFDDIAQKPESMGICFIGNRKFKKFMSEYVNSRPGHFININDGKIEGMHNGIHLYTLGQRACIPGLKESLYVVEKNPETSVIYVSPHYYHPIHYRSIFITEKPHWIAEAPDLTYKQEVKYRFVHGRPILKCDLVEINSGKLLVNSIKPLRAITPGQYAVFYKKGECLGSAKITDIGPSEFSLGREVSEDFKKYEQETWDSLNIEEIL